METPKRSKNFTEREKILLVDIAKQYTNVIENKKTDGSTVKQKKEAWLEITKRFNASSDSGPRNDKQLHALFDNLKKNARRNISDDRCEMYKTGGGTFQSKTTIVDQKVVSVLATHFQPLHNPYDSSAPYYEKGNETISQPTPNAEMVQLVPIPQNQILDLEAVENEGLTTEVENVEEHCEPVGEQCQAGAPLQVIVTAQQPAPRCKSLTEKKKKSINNITQSIVKRKSDKQTNDDLITAKKIELLNVQIVAERMKMKKTKELLQLDIQLKQAELQLKLKEVAQSEASNVNLSTNQK